MNFKLFNLSYELLIVLFLNRFLYNFYFCLSEVIKNERLSAFKFSMCNIKVGERYSLSSLARKILNKNYQVPGPKHFTYKGEALYLLRSRIANNNTN